MNFPYSKPALLLIFGVCTGLGKAGSPPVSPPNQPPPSALLDFQLTESAQHLETLTAIANSLETLKPYLPALIKLLSTSKTPDAQNLIAVLRSAEARPKAVTLPDRAGAVAQLIALTENLQTLKTFHPDTLELLATIEGGADLTELLSGLFAAKSVRSSKTRWSPDQIKILLAQPAAADRQPSAVLRIEENSVSLNAGDRVKTPTGFVELYSVTKHEPGLKVRFGTEAGEKTVIYP